MVLSTARVAFVAALLSLPVVAAAQGTVSGTVTDADTDAPLPGVTVYV